MFGRSYKLYRIDLDSLIQFPMCFTLNLNFLMMSSSSDFSSTHLRKRVADAVGSGDRKPIGTTALSETDDALIWDWSRRRRVGEVLLFTESIETKSLLNHSMDFV